MRGGDVIMAPVLQVSKWRHRRVGGSPKIIAAEIDAGFAPSMPDTWIRVCGLVPLPVH